jgi:hypothetical protein
VSTAGSPAAEPNRWAVLASYRSAVTALGDW